MRTRILALVLAAVGLPPLAGCDRNGDTNAGLTNGPPPSADEKPAGRSDLPGSAAPERGEAAGRLGDTGTNAGTGGMGGGNAGGQPDQPRKDASANPNTVRATPPVRGGGDPNTAAGGTKPAGTIQTGTPKSPQ